MTAGDKRTAQDLVTFLKAFVERFPGYAGRPFWISGESYGGHLRVCWWYMSGIC